MLRAEAVWLQEVLAGIGAGQSLLNVASSTADFRELQQPYIEELVFAPVVARGACVVHTDLKRAAGVDVVGDITDAETRRRLGQHDVVVCSNLLEHVADREPVEHALLELTRAGGLLVVTVPYAYPHHPDPVDTLYRPTVTELAASFPRAALVRGDLVGDARYLKHWLGHDEAERRSSWRRLAMTLVRDPRCVPALATALSRRMSASCVAMCRLPDGLPPRAAPPG